MRDKRTAIMNEGAWRDTDGNLIQVSIVPDCLLTLARHQDLMDTGCFGISKADVFWVTGTRW